jgi:hypothetical protein
MTDSFKQRKAPPPFSIRFSWEERERLAREAGQLSMTAHIRCKLFDGDVAPKKLIPCLRQSAGSF